MTGAPPVIAFGTGEATFDLARVLSKPIKEAVRIKRGTGRTSWFIKKGDWYVEASFCFFVFPVFLFFNVYTLPPPR